jgi:hypothetical protein
MGNINEHCHTQTGFEVKVPPKDGKEKWNLLLKSFRQHSHRL